MLHVTNGDSVLHSFRDGAMPGNYLAWRDVLHDGPVPMTSTLAELSDIRARFLGGDDDHAAVRADLAERDGTLAAFREHQEVTLWFEHDLYDQLQLIQILDWFSEQDLGTTRLTLIQIDRHPDVQPFYGLGQLSGEQLLALLPSRQAVTREQLTLAHDAWSAFRAPDPERLTQVAARYERALPFLSVALTRFLEEYPSVRNGLSRGEEQILKAGAQGARTRLDYYRGSQALEGCPWGDTSIFDRMDRLAAAPLPALHRQADEFTLTAIGRQLLEGTADWVRLQPDFDVWLGGVHMDRHARWRWDGARGSLRLIP
jgi:hypothetical protein